jgi:hypothetical protein
MRALETAVAVFGRYGVDRQCHVHGFLKIVMASTLNFKHLVPSFQQQALHYVDI